MSDWVLIPVEEMGYNLLGGGLFLAGLTLVNLASYYLLNNLFDNNMPDYRALEPYKKRYVVKNFTKSVFLFFIAMGTLPWLFDLIINDRWNNFAIRFLGTIYVSTDLSGLLFVPRLSTSTKIHHTIVCILGTLNLISDYQQNGLHRALISLTYLSAIPYLVNTYLGLRHLNRDYIKQKIVDLALLLYSLSMVTNFWLQHAYVFHWVPGFSWFKVVYLAFYYLIFLDDLKLDRYLYRKSEMRRRIIGSPPPPPPFSLLPRPNSTPHHRTLSLPTRPASAPPLAGS